MVVRNRWRSLRNGHAQHGGHGQTPAREDIGQGGRHGVQRLHEQDLDGKGQRSVRSGRADRVVRHKPPGKDRGRFYR